MIRNMITDIFSFIISSDYQNEIKKNRKINVK